MRVMHIVSFRRRPTPCPTPPSFGHDRGYLASRVLTQTPVRAVGGAARPRHASPVCIQPRRLPRSGTVGVRVCVCACVCVCVCACKRTGNAGATYAGI
eukprot:430847-Rhodomonas_salina.3